MFAGLGIQTERYATAASWICLIPIRVSTQCCSLASWSTCSPRAASGIPGDLARAQPGGQVVYGARGAAIDGVHVPSAGHRHPPAPLLHRADVRKAAQEVFGQGNITPMRGPLGLFGQVYEVGEYEKTDTFHTSRNS